MNRSLEAALDGIDYSLEAVEPYPWLFYSLCHGSIYFLSESDLDKFTARYFLKDVKPSLTISIPPNNKLCLSAARWF